ncbi:MAG TPA: adenylate/guanylate cyclase domain-containing protein, partial [Verrucomicrobiae bacterium]|nr:adenylate/guanylate cyclase domain-containing protein [Verrucomicrobiae bacterium]
RPGREIILHGAGGLERRIPIDAENRLYVDWSFRLDSPQLTRESFHGVLRDHMDRARGDTNELRNLWRDKLVLVGSIASGNDLTDLGATPLEKETVLTCRYWNVANSVLTGRFVRQPPLAVELLLICGLAVAAVLFAWRMRALGAALATFLITALYAGIASQIYLHSRLWLPVVLPCAGLVLTHFALVTYRVIFEQGERRRIKGVFDKIVSPNIVSELLRTEKLALGGARRNLTVFFADVRGFTGLTDESHASATAYVAEQRLTGAEAEAYFDSQSEELLRTVNLYLGAIADIVKKHQGTLDKYIGDSVMAFWGAPTPNERHALTCVRAAMEAQRALYQLNQQRAADNKRREEDNVRRAAAGEPLLPLLKLFSIGIGVNTGTVTVGLLGSERHTLNYTIVGREVNLAQRLESHSGRDRILIGEATYMELLRDDPALAAACQPQLATQFKGFRSAIQLFEVPWKPEVLTPAIAPPSAAAVPPRAAA